MHMGGRGRGRGGGGPMGPDGGGPPMMNMGPMGGMSLGPPMDTMGLHGGMNFPGGIGPGGMPSVLHTFGAMPGQGMGPMGGPGGPGGMGGPGPGGMGGPGHRQGGPMGPGHDNMMNMPPLMGGMQGPRGQNQQGNNMMMPGPPRQNMPGPPMGNMQPPNMPPILGPGPGHMGGPGGPGHMGMPPGGPMHMQGSMQGPPQQQSIMGGGGGPPGPPHMSGPPHMLGPPEPMRQNVSAAAMAQASRGGTGYKAPGSQSAAPGAKEVKNDYCQQFVDTGARPQNYLRDSHLTDRYEEYPKLKELIRMKDQMVADNVTPAYFLNADLRTLKLSPETFGTKFDVILIDPPWEEYVRRAPHAPGLRDRDYWTWQQIQALEVENIADTPSFVFLWCGTAEGLDAGRHCLNKWGFRRVEDIVWIKTNKERNPRTGYLQAINQEPYSILVHTKEHCLMGIKGSVRRNMDGHIIHANCDTDVIVWEEPPNGSTEKPTEMYEIIERFCLGKRRLELFGEEHNIRNGWVTVGRHLPPSNFRPEVYTQHFRYPDGRVYTENTMGGRVPRGAPILIPTPPEVEEARPRSPPNQRGR